MEHYFKDKSLIPVLDIFSVLKYFLLSMWKFSGIQYYIQYILSGFICFKLTEKNNKKINFCVHVLWALFRLMFASVFLISISSSAKVTDLSVLFNSVKIQDGYRLRSLMINNWNIFQKFRFDSHLGIFSLFWLQCEKKFIYLILKNTIDSS